jgi:hypothetical protein
MDKKIAMIQKLIISETFISINTPKFLYRICPGILLPVKKTVSLP